MNAVTTAADAPDPRVLWAGQDGLSVRFALVAEPVAMAAAQRLFAGLQADMPAGVTEIVPALVSVYLRFDPSQTKRDELAQELRVRAAHVAQAPATPPAPLRRWTIPAAFGGQDGPQLSEVAGLLAIDDDLAVRQICDAELQVLAIGFAPGQPYIGLLPEAWNLPRQSELTPEVPAGAIVVAVRQLVMFGAISTTGWRQVGRTAFRSFVVNRPEPFPLRSGDAIRFRQVAPEDIDRYEMADDSLGGAECEILR